MLLILALIGFLGFLFVELTRFFFYRVFNKKEEFPVKTADSYIQEHQLMETPQPEVTINITHNHLHLHITPEENQPL